MSTPPTTIAPHIVHVRTYVGLRSECRLCGASHHATDELTLIEDADAWAEAHAAVCTPDSVRQTAAGLRAAVDEVRDLAEEGDPALWDEGDGQRARLDIVTRLRSRALELETNADTAAAASSGSVAARADGDPSS